MSSERRGEYLIIELAVAGRAVTNVGVLLWDPDRERLSWRLVEDWSDLAPPEDVEVLGELSASFRQCVAGMGPRAFLEYIEDTWSNVLRLSERKPMRAEDFDAALDALYERHVGR